MQCVKLFLSEFPDPLTQIPSCLEKLYNRCPHVELPQHKVTYSGHPLRTPAPGPAPRRFQLYCDCGDDLTPTTQSHLVFWYLLDVDSPSPLLLHLLQMPTCPLSSCGFPIPLCLCHLRSTFSLSHTNPRGHSLDHPTEHSEERLG